MFHFVLPCSRLDLTFEEILGIVCVNSILFLVCCHTTDLEEFNSKATFDCYQSPTSKNTMKLTTMVMTSLLASSVSAFTRLAPRTFQTASVRAMTMLNPTEFAKVEIASNDIMVFSKSFCPYCTKTKTLLDGMGLAFNVVELDKIDNGADIQAALLEISGQRTVPNVFVKGTHLGGNDDTQAAAKSGKLREMLN